MNAWCWVKFVASIPHYLQVNAYTTPPPILRVGGLNKYDVDKPYASINEILYNWLYEHQRR